MTHDQQLIIKSFRACLREVRHQIMLTPNDQVRPLYQLAQNIMTMIDQVYKDTGVIADAK